VIAQMEKLFILGPKRLAPAILLDLQQAGVVQIDPLRTGEIGEYRLSREEEILFRRWDAVTTSVDHTLRLLDLEADLSVEPFDGDLPEAEAMVLPREQRAAALVEKRVQLEEELELIDQYREITALLADAVQGLDASPWLTVLPFLVEGDQDLVPLEQELAATLDERFLLAQRPAGGGSAAVIIVLKRDAEDAKGALSHRGLAELPRPGEYTRMNLDAMALRLEEGSRLVPQELAAVEQELSRLIKEAGRPLKGLWNRAKNESNRYHALRDTASGGYGFALFGWVPVRLKSRVAEAMGRFEHQTLYAFEPAGELQEAEQVPVMLENPEWIKPFESLISFLNTPRYGSWDPSWVVAAFFPLWFGMIVGDIGYALMFAGLCGYLWLSVRRNRTLTVDFFKLRLSPDALTQVIRVTIPMICWTVLWGILYGEFFGDLLQRVGIFETAQHPGMIPILIPRTDTVATANGLILVSIAFGIYQVLYGFYLKALRSHREGQKKHFWEASGYLGGVAALILFAYAFMTGDFRLWLIIPTLMGAAVFLIGMILAGMPLMIAELPTQGGHILSYIRIYAVGLASAILANLATGMGYSLYHLLGIAGLVIGLAAGALMGLVIHTLLLVLLTVSHVLQPIRLIWVEFFTKFDFYTVSGRPYRPFKSICNSS
jgi:V/A-type H+-transporting ATPase subunit I